MSLKQFNLSDTSIQVFYDVFPDLKIDYVKIIDNQIYVKHPNENNLFHINDPKNEQVKMVLESLILIQGGQQLPQSCFKYEREFMVLQIRFMNYVLASLHQELILERSKQYTYPIRTFY